VVSVGDASGPERDDALGSVFVPVTLSTTATEPVTVTVTYCTVNDTAIYIPPEDRTDVELFGDYQGRGTPDLPRTVTIPAGSLQTTISVAVNTDDEGEPDEQLSVVIASVTGADAVIGDDTARRPSSMPTLCRTRTRPSRSRAAHCTRVTRLPLRLSRHGSPRAPATPACSPATALCGAGAST